MVRKFYLYPLAEIFLWLNWVVKPAACNLAEWQHFNFPGKQIFTAAR